MNAKLLEERTVFHIGTPARVERVRFAPDFHMTPDADFRWVHQLQPERFPAGRPYSGVCREPVPASQWMPVTLDQPAGAFAGVPASGPTPASDPTVTSRAGADRLLRTEPQVRLTNLFSYRTITGTSSLFHTHALPLVSTRFLRLAKISPSAARNASLGANRPLTPCC